MTATPTVTATEAEANPTGLLSESPSLLSSSRATSAASSWLHELAVSSSLSLSLSPLSLFLYRWPPLSLSLSPPAVDFEFALAVPPHTRWTQLLSSHQHGRSSVDLSLQFESIYNNNNKSVTLCMRVCCVRVCE